ncbi:response regulator transcription factor [Leptolyngbya iicbica]|uniref:DNA-binding response regulator n=2 Tax=Cyanophyceae TaxID=3028117 RepID=A0A4Q7E9I3_9CYAN|nr:response regulator transcription factor [Leptolyngbya sp. LK]RZM79517.1 DNA-binding response regulator [Leptolyngbya sp. LK]
MRILVIEDDRQLTEVLADALSSDGYMVEVAADGELGWNLITAEPFDLIVLDLTLPKLDGISLCQQLREQALTLPVLMLTARDTLDDKIMGLDAGADDYMVKPFEMSELRARVRALLRRGQLIATPDLSWGNELHLNPSTHEAYYAGQLLPLTPKEFGLLDLLITHGRRVLSRGNIIEHLWSLEDTPTEETVKSHIKGLRHKLRAAGAPDDLIETVHGVGYRLKKV